MNSHKMIDDEKRLKIFIGNVAWNAGEADLKAVIDETGITVHEFIFPPSSRGFASRGFAFVIVDEQDAEDFIHALDGKLLMDRILKCEIAERQQYQPRRDRFIQ